MAERVTEKKRSDPGVAAALESHRPWLSKFALRLCRRAADAEDLVTVLAGHASLRREIEAGSEPVHVWLREELRALAAGRAFLDAIPGCLPGDTHSQARALKLTRWLESLAATNRDAVPSP